MSGFVILWYDCGKVGMNASNAKYIYLTKIVMMSMNGTFSKNPIIFFLRNDNDVKDQIN